MAYSLKYDLHTHTIYSRGIKGNHGKGTVLENARVAHSLGLEALGISDHGPGHIFYGMDMDYIGDMRRDVNYANELFPGLKVYLSVEANIINPSGKLDVPPEDFHYFDYVIAGYHYGVLGEEPVSAIKVCLGGYKSSFGGTTSEGARNYNTDLVVKALYNNHIKILTHPGDKADFDIDEISKACEETHTLMEINNHHNGLTVEGIRIAAKYNVDFIISSDAHIPGNVGTFDVALKRAREAGLPLERIVNLWNS